MNVEIGAEAALLPEKEYINGIAVAVQFLLNKLLLVNKRSYRPFHTGERKDYSRIRAVELWSSLIKYIFKL
jgi:hypothetical protein